MFCLEQPTSNWVNGAVIGTLTSQRKWPAFHYEVYVFGVGYFKLSHTEETFFVLFTQFIIIDWLIYQIYSLHLSEMIIIH